MAEQTFTATLHSVVRKSRLSKDANPGYVLNTGAGTFETLADASVNYDIPNHGEDSSDSWCGKRVKFTATMSGRVTGWELAE